MVKMSQLIDAAVAKAPTGIVVSIPNPDALSPAIEKAIAANIPVVSMNSGSDVFRDLGILAHVGQTEYEAGLGAGDGSRTRASRRPSASTRRSATRR